MYKKIKYCDKINTYISKGDDLMKDFSSIYPIYYVDEEDEKLIKSIEEKINLISLNNINKKKNLKIKSRVRSIYSSLAIL